MPANTETDFEHAIEHGLTVRDRYHKGDPKAFDPAIALFPDDVISFSAVRLNR
jgi:type I restriction enzyme R subunit